MEPRRVIAGFRGGQKGRAVMPSPNQPESPSRLSRRVIVLIPVLMAAILGLPGRVLTRRRSTPGGVGAHRLLRTLVVGATVTVALVVGGSKASAQGSPSDPRAVFIMGNVAPGDCRGLGAPIPVSAITFTITTGQILTITAVDPGFVVTAIFVKGGADTNLYQPGLRGLPPDPPWINLISPLTGGGQLPAISHWFACGSVTPPTTTTTTTTSTTTTTAPTTTTTAPTTTSSASSSTTSPSATTTSTTVAVGPATSSQSSAEPTAASSIPTTGGEGASATNVALFALVVGCALVVAARLRTSASGE